MEDQIEYLRAKVLWNHLHQLSITNCDVTMEVSDGLTFASAISLLEAPCDEEDLQMKSIGGITSNDITRYEPPLGRFDQKAMKSLLESLDKTLEDITLYFHGAEAEDLNHEERQSLAISLGNDVQTDVARTDTDFQALLSRLDTVVNLYLEATKIHPHLHDTLHEILEALPSTMNAKHNASSDFLAMTVETSLLKLSVVRARLQSTLYGYASPLNPRVTISSAVKQLYEKLTAHQLVLESQEQDMQSRLREYEQLLELMDGNGAGFAQVVEDLATVKRETEECRRDLRRLGWTEN
ncbi:hypothetical protein K439DRAFT_1633877 [Ramaria rubella]|nr:hypothetical protein K439DRAFT_1633877 [Ramaria rubella]